MAGIYNNNNGAIPGNGADVFEIILHLNGAALLTEFPNLL